MPHNRKPCARVAPGQGLEIDQQLSDGSITQTNSQPTRVRQALLSAAIAVSDGRETLGYIVEVDGSSVAVTPDGITLGSYRRRKDAFKAVSQQHRSS
jgi:hypothetical protein